jgi:hypothetical protein
MSNGGPITHNGRKLFQIKKFLGQLATGDMFKTKYGATVYTVGQNNTILDEQGKEAYYPQRMPVIQLKAF